MASHGQVTHITLNLVHCQLLQTIQSTGHQDQLNIRVVLIEILLSHITLDHPDSAAIEVIQSVHERMLFVHKDDKREIKVRLGKVQILASFGCVDQCRQQIQLTVLCPLYDFGPGQVLPYISFQT